MPRDDTCTSVGFQVLMGILYKSDETSYISNGIFRRRIQKMRGAGSGSRGGFSEFQMKRTRRKLKDLWDACAIDDAYACDNCAPDARVKGAKYKAYIALPFKYGVGVVIKDNGQLSDSLFIVPFRDVSKYHRQITQEDKGSFNAVSCKSYINEIINCLDRSRCGTETIRFHFFVNLFNAQKSINT
jgi:hypothetical protein